MDNSVLNSDIIMERAEAALISRDFEQAARLYRSILNTDPENTVILDKLGNLFVKAGNDETALSYFTTLSRIEPENVEALNNMGAIYRRMKRYDESIAVLEKAVIANENDIQTFYNLGFTFKLMGKYGDAIACFEKVIAQNPSDVLAYNHIGTIYQAQDMHPDAVQSFLHGLKVDQNHPILHYNLAKSYRILNDFEKAKQEYESALKSKPLWNEATEDYANMLLDYNKTKKAADLVKKAISVNSKDIKMITKMGDIQFHQDDFDAAESYYETALSLDGKYIPALNGLASSFEATERPEDALKVVEKMNSIEPDDKNVQNLHAKILLSANRLEEASSVINSIISKDKNDLNGLSLLGQYYICSGNDSKALGCFKKIKEIKPDSTEFYIDGAKRFTQKGNFEKAEDFLLKYTKNNSENVHALKQLALNYEAQGKFSEAKTAFSHIGTVDEFNVASKIGIERINKKIEEENRKKIFKDTGTDALEGADDDIFADIISVPVEEKQEEKPVQKITEEAETVPLFEKEELSERPQDDFVQLKSEDYNADNVFDEIDLDKETEFSKQDKFVQLDDLVSSDNFEDGTPSLIEDNTTAEDFFGTSAETLEPTVVSDNYSEPVEQNLFEKEEVNSKKVQEEDLIPEQRETPKELKNPVIENLMSEDKEVSKAAEEIRDRLQAIEDRINFLEEKKTEESAVIEEPENSIEEGTDMSEDEIINSLPDAEEMEKLSKQLQEINNQAEANKKTEIDAALFEKLLSLSQYLPQDQKEEFLQSKIRLQLEYIISKLKGHKGLVKTCTDFRDKHNIVDKDIPLSGLELLKYVLTYTQDFSLFHPDEEIGHALYTEIGRLLEELPE